MDRLTPEHRSWNMSRIRSKDTKPERALRSALHRAGFRFRLHRKDLPGKPDLVLSRYRTVIFLHGCFWHRHPRCRMAYTPKSRIAFWNAKFASNIARDKRVNRQLRSLGWRCVIVWECELRHPEKLVERLGAILGPKTRPSPARAIPHR